MELDELIPVEQFFEDYVSRLQTSAVTEDRNPYAIGGVHRRPSNISPEAIPRTPEILPLTQQPYGGFSGPPPNYPTFMEPQPMRNYGDSVGSTPPPPKNDMYLDPYPNRRSSNAGLLPPFSQTEGVGDYSSAAGGGSGLYTPTPPNVSPFSSGPPLDESQSFHATPGMDLREMGSGQGFRKARPKTARQQQLNKLAQQRYRERKKAKTLGLEQTVNALSDQLKQLSAIKEEKVALEEKNLMLERKLIEKEAELQTMRNLLEDAKRGTGNNTVDLPVLPKEERSMKPIVGLDSRPAKLFHKKVKDLQKYLKNNNLDPEILVNPLDDNIPKKAVDDIYHLVGDVCMTCMQLTRHDGPDLWDLITASLDSKQRESHDRVMWRSIAKSLKLGRDQIASALSLREQHLAKLEKIYVQRQTLNLEAIQHLLPADQGGRAPVSTPLGCFNIASFVQRLRHTSRLNSVLDRLKGNLSKEQKLNSELEYMTFYRVMSPLQGAWFTVSAYPHQCDCLEFLNAVSDLYATQIKEASTSSSFMES